MANLRVDTLEPVTDNPRNRSVSVKDLMDLSQNFDAGFDGVLDEAREQIREIIGEGSPDREQIDALTNYFKGDLPSGEVYKIPSDFATITEAMSRLRFQVPEDGTQLEVRIESGHRITEGFSASGGDYSHIKLTSEDKEVFLSRNFVPVDGSLADDSVGDSVLVFMNNARSFLYAIKMNGEMSDRITAIAVAHGASFQAVEAYDFRYGAVGFQHGFRGRNCNYSGRGMDFNNSWKYAMRFTSSSFADAGGCRGNDCGYGGFSEGDLGGPFYASRNSHILWQTIECNNSGASGVSARRSFVALNGAKITNAKNRGVDCRDGSYVILTPYSGRAAVIKGSGNRDLCVYTDGGGIINASGADYETLWGVPHPNFYGAKGVVLDSEQSVMRFDLRISRDNVETIPLPSKGGSRVMMMTLTNGSQGTSGIAWVRASNSHCEVLCGGLEATGNSETVLSGTTGNSGKITVSVVKGTMYVENRTGDRDITIEFSTVSEGPYKP